MTLRHDTRILATRLPLAAAAFVTIGLVLAGCDGSGTSDAVDPAGSSSTPTPDPSPAPTRSPKPRLIGYAGGESPGVTVHGSADAGLLAGAPQAFQDFIGTLAQRLADEADCDAAVGVTVQTLRTDGYAVGGVDECGGYAALWAVVDGHWKQIQGTQDSWDCRVLRRYRVPNDVVGDQCYDYGTQEAQHYHQA